MQEIVRWENVAVNAGCRRLLIAREILIREGKTNSNIDLQLLPYKVADCSEEESRDLLAVAEHSDKIDVIDLDTVLTPTGDRYLAEFNVH